MNDSPDFITLNEIDNCMKQLPAGKSAGLDGVPGEVLKMASHRLRVHIAVFINACIKHCYLPPLLMRTILVPLIKDKLKPASDSDNYRLIAIANAFSKLFEHIILTKITSKLETTENQFGFKEGHGTEMCIYLLKDVINYYRSKHSPVFCCFLDARKAFDRVNHAILFEKMLQRAIPIWIVKLIAHWYTHQEVMIRWGNLLSDPFTVSNGIKQGGILSPQLYNLYVDNLSAQLTRTQIGCFAGNLIINHLLYADDLVLIAPSARALQKLMNICEVYAKMNDIIYNTDKTKCLVCWPKFNAGMNRIFQLQGVKLETVHEFKYLGVLLTDDLSDDAEIKKRTRGVYATGNKIIDNFRKCNDSCKVAMFRTYCYAIYCCALWSSCRVSSLAKIKVANNDVFRMLMQEPRMTSASTLFALHARVIP